ncbi:MAG: hypothetical protein KKB31_02345 [Nanoarchaeota archaeon]|nr:hypothetical protein [Nanoarchaeota archaeon]
MYGLTKEEIKLFKRLNTPVKIQDFLDGFKINFEEEGDTCMSPRMVLKERKCHCIEGAILAALILRVNGHPPLLVDLEANSRDFDHVITVFKKDGMWGAITKTNHAVLRYREPIYGSIRELVMSYFHEYFDDKGRKNLRAYSLPVNLSRFDGIGWMITEDEVWEIPEFLAEVKHFPILIKSQIHCLRRADAVEIEAGKIVEWKENSKKKK